MRHFVVNLFSFFFNSLKVQGKGVELLKKGLHSVDVQKVLVQNSADCLVFPAVYDLWLEFVLKMRSNKESTLKY